MKRLYAIVLALLLCLTLLPMGALADDASDAAMALAQAAVAEVFPQEEQMPEDAALMLAQAAVEEAFPQEEPDEPELEAPTALIEQAPEVYFTEPEEPALDGAGSPSITFDKTSLEIDLASSNTATLNYTISNISSYSCSWSWSSNVTVAKGAGNSLIITASEPGVAVIEMELISGGETVDTATCTVTVKDSSEVLVEVKVTGTFHQSDARAMLSMVNDFRTGSGAWQWNSDDTTKTVFNTTSSNTLGALTYDYALEQIAMQRAIELAVHYDHTRPNGHSCFSLWYNGISSYGENIAYGYRTTAEMFDGWREENDPYTGQGHRRNMLNKGFTAIGIACFEYNGRKYWAQELGYYSGASATAANDSAYTGTVECSEAYLGAAVISRFPLNQPGEPEVTRKPGDVNGDGSVTRADRIMLARYVAQWPGITVSKANADVNGDGDINRADRIMLARYVAQWPGVELK